MNNADDGLSMRSDVERGVQKRNNPLKNTGASSLDNLMKRKKGRKKTMRLSKE